MGTIEQPTQRRFSVMGENTFRLANKVLNNQTICRLLKYQTRNPLLEIDPATNKPQPDVDGVELINKQILIVPKIYDDSVEKMSYIVILFNDYVVNQLNNEFKTSTIRFDIACPYDEWLLDERTLRPYLIMQEIDSMFNDKHLTGIGTLQFLGANQIILNDEFAGLTMMYSAIHGEEDKKNQPNPVKQEQFEADFDELYNNDEWTLDQL